MISPPSIACMPRPCRTPGTLLNATRVAPRYHQHQDYEKTPFSWDSMGEHGSPYPQLAATIMRSLYIQHGSSTASGSVIIKPTATSVAGAHAVRTSSTGIPCLSIAYTDSKRSSATGGHTFCPMETAIRSPGRLIEDYRKLLQG